MALPQGIPFRSTSGYVTDGANDSVETSSDNSASGAINSTTYPRTTAQGNNVGYEVAGFSSGTTRNRSSSIDVRLAGVHGTNFNNLTFRIDLPSAGYKAVRFAAGDASYSLNITPPGIELFDTTTGLGTLVNTATTGAAKWRDATNVERTSDTDWATNNASVTNRFLTTIARFTFTNPSGWAYLYIEDAATPANAFVRAKFQLFPKTVMRRLST